MIEVSATGKTGRSTTVTVDGKPLSGVTKVVIQPIVRDTILTADIEIFADTVHFQGELGTLTIRHLGGEKRVFKRMEELTNTTEHEEDSEDGI